MKNSNKTKTEVTVTDITVEAKRILATAMNNFCNPADTKEKEKQIYLADRHNYWLGLGYTHEVATSKANVDYEWAF